MKKQFILGEVKNSPIQKYDVEGNTFYVKEEYRLPYGESHYSRIFATLLFLKEQYGYITPGDRLLETTSGSGGRAFAKVAKAMGYHPIVAIPAGGEVARERAILEAGAELVYTPEREYVNGFPRFVKRYLATHKEVKYVGHMMGDLSGRGSGVNWTAIEAFRPFVREVLEVITPDLVFTPIGNGTTTLPMLDFQRKGAKVFGVEAVSSALGYRKFYGDTEYQRVFGVDPEALGRHDLPGTTPVKTDFPMPAVELAVPQLDGVILVTSEHTNRMFQEVTGQVPAVPQWDTTPILNPDYGRTFRAAFAAALNYLKVNNLQGKKVVLTAFDAAWHYDR